MTPAQVQKVETEISNLTDAIAGGLLRSSSALAERLHATEAELSRLRDAQAATAAAQNAEKVLTGVEAQFGRIRENFERALCDQHGGVADRPCAGSSVGSRSRRTNGKSASITNKAAQRRPC